MEKLMSMLLMLVIFDVFIQLSHAVTCYQCSSLISSNCGDPFKSGSTCRGEMCVKAKYDANGWLSFC